MATQTKIALNTREKSLVEVLWNLYILQNANVKKAFCLKIKDDFLSDHNDAVESQSITETAHYQEAMKDVEEGRISHYDSLKDFYKEMGL